MKFWKLLKFSNSSISPYQSTDFFMIGASVTKELTTLNNKFTESEDKKENNFSLHVILVWHVYISIFMSFSDGWVQVYDITNMFINTEAGVPRFSVKMVSLTVSKNSLENINVGVSY